MKKNIRPFPGSTSLHFCTLILGAWIAGTAAGHARPAIRDSFFQVVYPSAQGTQIEDLPSASRHPHCGVCHYDFNGGGTKNHYGEAVYNSSVSNGFALNKEPGISNAINSVAFFDSDGDGVTNYFEITDTNNYVNTPTFPGLTPANISQVVNVTASEVQPYLVPSTGGDTTPPSVTVTFPNGGETLTANRPTNITWTADDASGIAAINIYLSLDDGATFTPIALGLQQSGTNGSFSWFPANRPVTNLARLLIVAIDNASLTNEDLNDAAFTITPPPGGLVGSTLRDFDLPGTQPFEGGPELDPPSGCANCHGGYDPAVEPYFNWGGSMMAHASLDLLFEANMAIANQDAPDSGDLCLRCHLSRGWLGGRSVPTDGTRMQEADKVGVSCDLCHRMVDPVYEAGVSPALDVDILSLLSFPGTNYGNGMFVIDQTSHQRGPFTNTAAPHTFAVSPFHQQSAFCGTCHDVSNPAFQNDGSGTYVPNDMNTTATNFSPHFMAPVERTYSEWLASAYNTATGVHAPQFAGNKTNGMVSTCQDCHMADVAGYGCDTNQFPVTPLRQDLPLHDLTGGSTWMPAMLTNLYPANANINTAAIEAGIARATALLQNAASLTVADGETAGQIKVTVTNECGHKLPTGYPEGRRIWLNVQFYNGTNLLSESGAYDTNSGVLTHDAEAKIYEVHPGIETNLAVALGLPPGPSLHFVLNNQIYEDNRIPPRGFTNASFAEFGGAPVGHEYADGQFWDDSGYELPEGATRAEVKLYYQSTSKEFIEFLYTNNVTNTKGLELYNLWNTNGKCPPTLMAEATWVLAFELQQVGFNEDSELEIHFLSRPGTTYTIQYTDSLTPASWTDFDSAGTLVATNTTSEFMDDFTAATSGGPSATGARFYRFSYSSP